jgi:hypothetical protein
MKNPDKLDAPKKSKPRVKAEGSDASKKQRKAKANGKAGKAEAQPLGTDAMATPRVKLVRDSFTMPRDEFALIATLKARALEFKRPTKKSELLRAGLQQLAALDDAQLRSALAALRPLPTGRPKKLR